MVEKKNTSEDLGVNNSGEIIERLVLTLADDETDSGLIPDQELDDLLIDELSEDDDKAVDHSLDSLFDEDRKSAQNGLHDEVRKALTQPAISKASLFRMRLREPSESAFNEEIAQLKTVEEVWEEPEAETIKVVNHKYITVMSILIAVFLLAGGWGVWRAIDTKKSDNGNKTASVIESRLSAKQSLEVDMRLVSEIVKQYLSASTVSHKSEYIYKVDSFSNDIESYYENKGGVKPVMNYGIKSILPLSLNGAQVFEVVMKNKDPQNKKFRSYYVRKNSEGEYKVDWKADVIFQDSDVKKFKETRSKKATNIKCIVNPIYDEMEMMPWVRKRPEYNISPVNIPISDLVFWELEPIYYNLASYNWGFNEKEYNVMRLEIPNSDMLFWGYIKKGSEAEYKLFQYMGSDLKREIIDRKSNHQFILKLRFLPDSPHENDQYVIIDDVVSEKWINMDE